MEMVRGVVAVFVAVVVGEGGTVKEDGKVELTEGLVEVLCVRLPPHKEGEEVDEVEGEHVEEAEAEVEGVEEGLMDGCADADWEPRKLTEKRELGDMEGDREEEGLRAEDRERLGDTVPEGVLEVDGVVDPDMVELLEAAEDRVPEEEGVRDLDMKEDRDAEGLPCSTGVRERGGELEVEGEGDALPEVVEEAVTLYDFTADGDWREERVKDAEGLVVFEVV